jgi:alkyl hydroperoxide reductase subunit AhpC
MELLLIGNIAPDFEAETTIGKISFHEWIGDSWCMFFSHPGDFTPVCTSEFGIIAKYKSKFEKLNTKVIGLSIANLESHLKWIEDINEIEQTSVDFPVISDLDLKISHIYKMIHPNETANNAVRNVFIIAPDKEIKLTMVYPSSAGRNFDEILRMINSLQLTANYDVYTPANWHDGDDVIISNVIPENEMPLKYPKGYKYLRNYYRTTPQPNK